MLLRRTVGPSVQPVTLSEIKAALPVDHADDDTILTNMIETAARLVGTMAGRVLTAETWTVSIPAPLRGDLFLLKSPVQSVSSITWYDAGDVQQTAMVGDFYLIKDDDIAYLRPKAGVSWPAANTVRDDAITVEFVAGYDECPRTLKHAVMMMVAHLYENRGVVSDGDMSEIPLGVRDMIDAEKLGWCAS